MIYVWYKNKEVATQTAQKLVEKLTPKSEFEVSLVEDEYAVGIHVKMNLATFRKAVKVNTLPQDLEEVVRGNIVSDIRAYDVPDELKVGWLLAFAIGMPSGKIDDSKTFDRLKDQRSRLEIVGWLQDKLVKPSTPVLPMRDFDIAVDAAKELKEYLERSGVKCSIAEETEETFGLAMHLPMYFAKPYDWIKNVATVLSSVSGLRGELIPAECPGKLRYEFVLFMIKDREQVPASGKVPIL